MASTLAEGEAPLGALRKGSPTLASALPPVPGCGSQGWTASPADPAGTSPSEIESLKGIGGHGGTTPPSGSRPLIIPPALTLFQIKFPLTSVAQTARPCKGLQKE